MTAPLQWRVTWAEPNRGGTKFVTARTKDAAIAKVIGELGYRPKRIEASVDRALTAEELADVAALVEEIER